VRQPTVHIEIFAVGCRAENESEDKQDCGFISFLVPYNQHKIFAILRAQIGHDFSQYKHNTLLRRINRRMGLNQIQDPEHYIRLLREHPDEDKALQSLAKLIQTPEERKSALTIAGKIVLSEAPLSNRREEVLSKINKAMQM
jgi:hypothetical protein